MRIPFEYFPDEPRTSEGGLLVNLASIFALGAFLGFIMGVAIIVADHQAIDVESPTHLVRGDLP